MYLRILIVCASLILSSCMVGPNYKRPNVAVPPQFRAGEAQPSQTSLRDTKWFDLFQDDTLRGLIKDALEANYDVRIAAQRALQAQGQLTATRSAMFPQLNGQASAGRSGVITPTESSGGM